MNEIEKIEDWEIDFNRLVFKSWKEGLWHSENNLNRDLKKFIKQKLIEVHNSALSKAIEAMPKRKDVPSNYDRGDARLNIIVLEEIRSITGFNSCREESIKNLEKLKI